MNINKEILQNITQKKETALKSFSNSENVHDLLVEIFSQLSTIDNEKIKNNLLEELIENCINEWKVELEQVDLGEDLYAILFEYDHLFSEEVYAPAYGIIGSGLKIKSIKYDIDDYDFIEGFEALAGLTMHGVEPLSKLDDNCPEKYKEIDFWEFDETGYLIDIYLFNFFLILHKTLSDFTDTQEFKKLYKGDTIQFLIGGHDDDVFPIYYVYNNERSFNNKIKNQEEPIDEQELEKFNDLRSKIETILNEETFSKNDEILFSLNELLKSKEHKSWS